ncbi:formate dehydrogenase accessory sulfurtransferase FdhD [Helicobacter sp. 13S00477-4]|uniref:formate dehydrogenase accessory sulfurtransferase FdhD n=1 Tax=Helicobacter sp. 13S00477-4 TaxID=1905759 RepID=UPI000BA4FE28|nr:formate dehydrogenase accessory sulfurtransferase FdhD [Helicobacter sp. 13S00477-4]PAF52204.1 sufurtransferase FdhD [Helicobacter sp. 13S00477-4]
MAEILKNILIHRFDGDEVFLKEDIVILENRVHIWLNGEKIISTMCIPMQQDAHAVGFLLSEGVIERVEDIFELKIAADGLNVFIQAKINENNLQNLYKEKTLVSGCGGGITGNTQNVIGIPFNTSALKIKAKQISKNIALFYKESELYLKTGCVHKAMLLFEDGFKISSEDIGRHNAIDKVAGKARLIGLDTSMAVLMVSGRLSSEMVIKAVMHSVPIVVSRTAPTFLGVKTAQIHGLTLIGFARGKAMNIYTHPTRVLDFDSKE